MPSGSNEETLQRVYGAYAADLIRTGGGLVRTTPSAIFRASYLFHQFQRSVAENYRCRYLTADEMAADSNPRQGTASSMSKVEYTVPEHAGTDTLPTGVVPLVDLRAPLDYCVHHIVEQEDVTYLAAACLLMAVKMEDPGVRIRHIVDAFARVAERRAGLAMNALLQPPPDRYDDFKSCVVRAEEQLLQELGFQTFVETPYKYVAVFIGLLVVDGLDDAKISSLPSSPRPSAAYTAWLSTAVSWLNDVPRCVRLVQVPPSQLAVLALHFTCPADVRGQLPHKWFEAFGLTEAMMKALQDTYQSYLGSVKVSAREEMEEIRAALPKPPYLKTQERAAAAAAAAANAQPLEAKAEAAPAPDPEVNTTAESSSMPTCAKATSQPTKLEKDEGSAENEEDDGGLDLLAVRKKRRREEKERARRERRNKDRSRSRER